ncbi:MAG TPA: hypothetical protein VE944_21355 [Nostoc sp.]|uniref:hypothetical protein n=1 Tax=Nostoc sp. TaxID=1180 RepID=UPI002D50BEDA|nr:hypothetical protein [Nostoc sp.]HYX16847.1 hypothetical protein [Nostoc sp.]
MIAHSDYKLHGIFLSLEQLHITVQRSDRTNSLIFMHLTDNLCHAIAPSHKLVLLTRNHRDLGKVPDC